MTTENMTHPCATRSSAVFHKLAAMIVMWWACGFGTYSYADPLIEPKGDDPHYADVGFFDIHVCNWPDRPLFFMSLFSTAHFSEIEAIEVLMPDGKILGKMDSSKYRSLVQEGMPEKRVYLMQTGVPANAPNDWYSVRITMKDGKKYVARDYVFIATLPIAARINPPHNAENIPLPKELSWSALAGAKYYQVFIKDLWDEERLIHTSGFLDQPRMQLPPGLIKPGGWYSWRVHARDVNEDKKLGDFNHGSLGAEQKFSVAQ